MQLRSIFLWTMIVSLSLAAVMGIAAILVPGFGTTQQRVLLTTLIVGLYSLPALACSIVLARRIMTILMWAGIVSALLAMALWIFLTWNGASLWLSGDVDEFLAKTAGTCTIVCLFATQVGLLMLLRLQIHHYRVVRLVTLAISGLLSLLLTAVIWFEISDESLWKVIAVLGILSACGTVVTPVLGLIETLKRRTDRESIPSKVEVELFCPRCKRRQMVRAGSARCVGCGLRIDIDVEEPRCQCGYLLYQLQSDTCPECGRAVSTS